MPKVPSLNNPLSQTSSVIKNRTLPEIILTLSFYLVKCARVLLHSTPQCRSIKECMTRRNHTSANMRVVYRPSLR